MSGNQELIGLLDREFRRIESAESTSFPTVKAMADRLELDKTFFSKLRSGERDLTKKKARHIAEKLRSGKPAKEMAQLEQELLAASQAASQFLLEIKGWFRERAKPGNLMVVEFRELPVVRPEGGRAWAAMIVAEAVAEGLTYAMINPFSMESVAIEKLPKPMKNFVNDLDEHLIETRRTILGYALDHWCHQNQSVSGAALKTKLMEVAQRLKLYRLAANDVSPCPGLGYRLFYTEHQESSRQEPIRAEPAGGKLWEWISSKEQDHMVQKEFDDEGFRKTTLKATTIRFFPIVEFWREKNRLPKTDKEITDFATELETSESYATGHGIDLVKNSPKWSVIGADEAVVEKYLQTKGGSAPASASAKKKK